MRDRDDDSRQCPACAYLCVDVSLGDEVTCVSCGTLFRVNRGFIEEAGSDPASTNPTSGASSILRQDTPSQLQPASAVSHEDPEVTDIRYFRRFFVLLQEIQASEAESPYHLLSCA